MKRLTQIQVLVMLFAAACANPDRAERETLERTGAIRNLHLKARPVLQLGTLDGTELEQFKDVRGALRLSDGRIVVAESSTQDLRVFSPIGEPLGSWAGRGEGPGEFKQLAEIFLLPGDTVAAYDLGTRRYSLFAPTGDFLRISHPHTRISYTAGFLSSDVIATYRDFAPSSEGISQGPPFFVSLQRFDGDTLQQVGPFSPSQNFQVEGVNGHYQLALPLAPQTHVVAGDDRVLVGNGGSRYVVLFDREKSRVDTLVVSLPRGATTSEDIRAFVDRQAPEGELNLEWRELHLRMVDEVPLPDSLPLFDTMSLDRNGGLWIRAYPSPGPGPRTWWRFDISDGRVTKLTVPENLRLIYQISEDFLLGGTWGEFDEPLIYLFETEEEG